MTRSATDVMQDILFAAVVDAVVAMKAASKGVPNTLLRDLNAIHANTAVADLPEALQAAVAASVRAAFTRLLREGYSVSPGRPAPAAQAPRPDSTRRPPRPAPRGDGPRPPRPSQGPPRGDGRPRGAPGGGRPRPRGKPGG